MADQQPVDVTELDASQLQDVGKQLEQELQHLTASYGQLKAAQAKFRTCIESVNAISPRNADKEILVPLTSSLYVPGTIADTQNVLVDVGTGYYVEKSTDDARKMYEGRVEYVTKSLEQLQETITRKEDNMRVVRDLLMMRLRQQPAGRQGGNAQAASAS